MRSKTRRNRHPSIATSINACRSGLSLTAARGSSITRPLFLGQGLGLQPSETEGARLDDRESSGSQGSCDPPFVADNNSPRDKSESAPTARLSAARPQDLILIRLTSSRSAD